MSTEEIAARELAATEGPWLVELGAESAGRWKPTRVFTEGGVDPWGEANDDYVLAENVTDEDAEFIAHARTDIPKLLSAIRGIKNYCTAMDMKPAEIRSDRIHDIIDRALR